MGPDTRTLEMSAAMGKAGIGLLLKDNDNGDYLEVMPLGLLSRIASARFLGPRAPSDPSFFDALM